MFAALVIFAVLWIVAGPALGTLAVRDRRIADRAGKGNASASGSPGQNGGRRG
jgi:hypothetical protein